MMLTLIPFFDRNMSVSAYSLFTRKNNFLMNPSLLGSRQFDGAAYVDGLELIQELGTTTLSGGKPIFVSLNNISIFSSLESECKNTNHAPILLIDQTFPPVSMYTDRIRELREFGYHFAIRNLPVHCYEDYAPILSQMDYILIDCQKIDAVKASFYFRKLYPDICICASNIPDMETFGKLSPAETISLFEGTFFRMPVTRGEHKVSPLKINYISLLNLIEEDDFDLTKAADIISQDTALIISLLRLANTRSFNSEITSVRVAVSMLGQKDLTRWIQTTVIEKLCSDKPNELMRLSLLRAKFAENLAPVFGMAMRSQELFLTGLFSILDIILDCSMEEALSMVRVSGKIRAALLEHTGSLAEVFHFIVKYESAEWQEVSRQLVLKNIEIPDVSHAWVSSLQWYAKLIAMNE
ncbi:MULTISPECIES: EAL and HDOD domain-containing protein [Roseburia]|uniref:EAL and HDOD domain-containing protein n=1 Tax=Roseburia TaxID=841 RepID=UPI0011067CD2|nr:MULTISPECIES: HDOD domain-containing protein [Roseburia]